jgi:hypothetical protein
VYVYPARGNQTVARVDFASSTTIHLANGDNAVTGDRDVANAAFCPRAVDDGAPTNHEIVHFPTPHPLILGP